MPKSSKRGLLAMLWPQTKPRGKLSSLLHTLRADERLAENLVREGKFQRSLSLITAFSSLLAGAEIAYEHYRGSYSQRKMYSPIVISPLLVAAGIGGVFSRRIARTALPVLSIITLGDGLLGFIFHVRGIARKPGGWRIPLMNVIMGPPVFAPLLFGICGYLGLIASMLRREDDPRDARSSILKMAINQSRWLRFLPRTAATDILVVEHDVREGRFQRQVAVAAALSAVFSGVEAWYSHYKNNFQYKVQWTPIALTPIIFVGGMGAIWNKRIAKTLLPVASWLAIADGTVGFFYHARGILRNPGGLRKLFYNIEYGPPIFAPLLFAASGFMGVLASMLRRKS